MKLLVRKPRPSLFVDLTSSHCSAVAILTSFPVALSPSCLLGRTPTGVETTVAERTPLRAHWSHLDHDVSFKWPVILLAALHFPGSSVSGSPGTHACPASSTSGSSSSRSSFFSLLHNSPSLLDISHRYINVFKKISFSALLFPQVLPVHVYETYCPIIFFLRNIPISLLML